MVKTKPILIPVAAKPARNAINRFAAKATREHNNQTNANDRLQATKEKRYESIALASGIRRAMWEGVCDGVLALITKTERTDGNADSE